MTNARPPYSLRVFWHDDDSGFIAESPEFEGVSAFGTTYLEAVAELEDALDLALCTLRAEDAPVPSPSIPSTYSGQFRLRLPRSWWSPAGALPDTARCGRAGVRSSRLVESSLALSIPNGRGQERRWAG